MREHATSIAPTDEAERIWRAAGAAWSARAPDWAYLVDPGARRVCETVLDRARVETGTLLLDIACGTGFALQLAGERGAVVSGLDASPGMLVIARDRSPRADLREGTMFALPFPEGSFDVVTSFNGIWAGCDDALLEVRRVLRPGGLVALSFFGPNETCPDAQVLAILNTLQDDRDARASREHVQIGDPGVAEGMLGAAGLTPIERGSVEAVGEWPDAELAWRAWAASGPAWAAIANVGEEAVRAAVLEVFEPLYRPGLGIRLAAAYAYIIGRLDLA